MSMVLMLFIAFMYQGVFSVHGVHGVYGVLLHYRTTGCSFNCLSMSLIIYITVSLQCSYYRVSILVFIDVIDYITGPYSVHNIGCQLYLYYRPLYHSQYLLSILMLIIIYITGPCSIHTTCCPFLIWCWLKHDFQQQCKIFE